MHPGAGCSGNTLLKLALYQVLVTLYQVLMALYQKLIQCNYFTLQNLIQCNYLPIKTHLVLLQESDV